MSVSGRTLTPMSHQPPQTWGPHHQHGLPGGITPRSGGYWWTVTTGTWLAAFTALGKADALSTLTLAALLSVAAAAVGWGEAQHGKPFASGHWVLFASATLASQVRSFCRRWLTSPGTSVSATTRDTPHPPSARTP